jgi:rhodanese-related sulfurtransferase
MIFIIFFFIILLILLLFYYNNNLPTKLNNNYQNSQLYIDINTARNTDFNIYIDVRTNFEYRTNGFYAKAINIPLSNIHNIQNIIPHKHTSILLYCNSGARSKKAADILYNLGYKNVRYITLPYTYLL